MTTEYIIKKLTKHGYEICRSMSSNQIVLTTPQGYTYVCESYAKAYRIARARHCGYYTAWR